MSRRRVRGTAVARLLLLAAVALAAAGTIGPAAASAADGETCAELSTAIDAVANGNLGDANPTDCFALTGVTAGATVRVRTESLTGSYGAYWQIADGDGNQICSGSWSSTDICRLVGGAGWTLRLDRYPNSTFPYAVNALRVDAPSGCSDLGDPSSWSFADSRRSGTIDGPLAVSCHRLTRAVGAADEAVWFRLARTSGAISPGLKLYGPTGTVECAGTATYPWLERCPLQATGVYTLMVDDSAGRGSGSYALTANRISGRAGCAAAPSAGFDAAPIAAAIGGVGEVDCHALAGVALGDRLQVDALTPSGNLSWAIVDGAGAVICEGSSWSDGCTLAGRAGWALLVHAQNGATPTYSATVRRINAAAGCADLDVVSSWSFTGGRVSGTIDGQSGARCYTFTRALGASDAHVWLRTVRTSGALSPGWRLYTPAGDRECSGGSSPSSCMLRATGTYTLVVDDDDRRDSGTFALTTQRLDERLGCGQLGPAAFDTPATSGAISQAGEVDCHELSQAAVGDRLSVGIIDGYWQIIDGDGVARCSGSGGPDEQCTLSGMPGWALTVHRYDAGTGAYSVATRRLNAPSGCAPLGAAAAWSFTGARVDGAIGGVLRQRCHSFSRGPGDPDPAVHLLRTVRTTGELSPQWRLYDGDGVEQCRGSTDLTHCTLRGDGDFAVVVRDAYGSNSGSYFLVADRLTDPVGCAPLPSVALGVPRTNGRIAGEGEVDCYQLDASTDDSFAFSLSGQAKELTVRRGDGEVVCWDHHSSCTLVGDGPFRVLVQSSGGLGTGAYSFEARCLNVPCGVVDTAVVDVVPNRVGAGSQASVVLRGRDLDLLSGAHFTRGGHTIDGILGEAAGDGRSREVRLDTTTAETGAWALEATFVDGSRRLLPAALTVTATRPARAAVQLIGRDVFRSGQPAAVTVQVSNRGNVDAIGVPVLLGGIPAGATIRPAFELEQFSGTGPGTELEQASFDQETQTVATADGALLLPLIVGRVPAEGSVELPFEITVPATTTDYRLQVKSGACLADAPGGAIAGAASLRRDGAANASCAKSFGGALLDAFMPDPGPCVDLYIDTRMTEFETLVSPQSSFGWGDAFGFLLGGASCVAEVLPRAKLARGLLSLASDTWTYGSAVSDCVVAGASAAIEQRAVASFDPNDIIGPAGTGRARYITGDGEQAYQVLFENLPAATAPAQRVEVVNQLDPTRFDPGSLRFREVRFGSTVVQLRAPSDRIDETVDLRPAQNLVVGIAGGVTPRGLVRWTLQAIDPDTLAPPDDPLAGFLPPNLSSPEGEGQLTYTVRLRDLAPGTRVDNSAAIVFDANAPIATPVWSNTIDRSPPTVGLTAAPTADPRVATVSWSGGDDASGVARWDLWVVRDGGTPALWRTAEEAGSLAFTGSAAGSYAFRAVAHDGAGNSTQSALSAVTLTLGERPGPERPGPERPGPAPDPGPGPDPDPGPAPVPPAAPGGAGGGPSGSGGVTPAPPAARPPSASSALRAPRRVRRAALGRGLAVAVTGARARGVALLELRAGRRTLATVRAKVAADGSVRATLRPRRGTTRALRAGAKLTVLCTLMGGDGRRVRLTATVRVDR